MTSDQFQTAAIGWITAFAVVAPVASAFIFKTIGAIQADMRNLASRQDRQGEAQRTLLLNTPPPGVAIVAPVPSPAPIPVPAAASPVAVSPPSSNVTVNMAPVTEAATEEIPTSPPPSPPPIVPDMASLQSAFDTASAAMSAAIRTQGDLITALQARRGVSYPPDTGQVAARAGQTVGEVLPGSGTGGQTNDANP